ALTLRPVGIRISARFLFSVTLTLSGNDPFSISHRSPAKAGGHAGRRYAIWTPAFAGEQRLT
ncbi:hypothetical protein, partial [Sphingopyxis granuli]|uniref:hypothetical protein n=1 Tax=Sphingopyxis granuli TaxID=267128 RepID=UPI001A9DC0E5